MAPSDENGRVDLNFLQYTDHEFSSSEREYFVSGEDTTGSDVRELDDEDLRSFSLLSSGYSIHLRLGDGFLRGFPSSVDVSDYSYRQPYCVSGTDRDRPLDGELLEAETVSPSHVFIASCAPVVDNNLTGFPVHVGTALLTGAHSMTGGIESSGRIRTSSITPC